MRRILVASVFALCACVTYREDLNRGHRLYEENQYERALAIWRVLEPDMDSLTFEDQTRYAYLRGMTDFRLGFRSDARHWLAIAKAIEQEHPGGLEADWNQRLEASLNELNREVYGGRAQAGEQAPSDPNAAPASGDSGAVEPLLSNATSLSLASSFSFFSRVTSCCSTGVK
jgi:hypothetical protein